MFAFNDISPFEDLYRLRRQMNDVFFDLDRSFGLEVDPLFTTHHLLALHNHPQQQSLQQAGKDPKVEEKYSAAGTSGTEQKADTSMNLDSTSNANTASGIPNANNSLTQVNQNSNTPANFKRRTTGKNDWLSTFPRIHMPKCDVVENADNYLITCELPGMSKEDVKLQVNDNGVMTISAEHSSTNEQKDPQAKYHRVERHFGKFERSLPLPKNVQLDQVSAKHENGLLKINLPKKAQNQADSTKHIQIN